jgi:hypothetical protein
VEGSGNEKGSGLVWKGYVHHNLIIDVCPWFQVSFPFTSFKILKSILFIIFLDVIIILFPFKICVKVCATPKILTHAQIGKRKKKEVNYNHGRGGNTDRAIFEVL